MADDLLPPVPPYFQAHECKQEPLLTDMASDIGMLPTSQSEEALFQSVLAAASSGPATTSQSQNLLPPFSSSSYDQMLPSDLPSTGLDGLDLSSVGVPATQPSTATSSAKRTVASINAPTKRAKPLTTTAAVNEAFVTPLIIPPPPPDTFKKTVVKRSGPLKTQQAKRNAHNAVERRYRDSINDRIADLKAILPTSWTTGPKQKTGKAAILHKTAEYLRFLHNQIERLQHEHVRLQELLKLHGVEDHAQFIPDDNMMLHLEQLSQSMHASNVNNSNANEPGVVAQAIPPPAPQEAHPHQPHLQLGVHPQLGQTTATHHVMPQSQHVQGQEQQCQHPQPQLSHHYSTPSAYLDYHTLAPGTIHDVALPPFDSAVVSDDTTIRNQSPSASTGVYSDKDSSSPAHSPNSEESSDTEQAAALPVMQSIPPPHLDHMHGFGHLQPTPTGSVGPRLMMATAGCAFAMFGTEYITGSMDVNSATAPSHGHARVLSSVTDEYATDVWQLVWTWMYTHAFWWLLRGVSALFFLMAVCLRDPIQSVETAQVKAAADAERKAAIKRHLSDSSAAYRHAKQSLAYLGQVMPQRGWSLYMTNLGLSVRQGLHRSYVGAWLDRQLAASHAHHEAILTTMARSYHHLHQLTLTEKSLPTSERLGVCYYYAMSAVNSLEMVSTTDVSLRAKVYAAMAAQLIVSRGANSWLAARYLGLARAALLTNQRDTIDSFDNEDEGGDPLDWLTDETGRAYFLSGAWHTSTTSSTLVNISRCHRRHLLALALRDLVRGRALCVASSRLQSMLTLATREQDQVDQCWALLALAAMEWRNGNPHEARSHLVQAEGLSDSRDRLQETVYSVLRSHQALLDGDHALCWKALERVSSLFSALTSSSHELDQNLDKLIKFWTLRQLMNTRVSLYRLRSYLSAASDEPLTTMRNPSGEAATFSDMLASMQHDLDMLSAFADTCAYAQPQLLMLRAVSRSLAQARTGPTEQLFNQSCRAARELQQPYDLGLALLHMSACLRGALPKQTLKQQLKTVRALCEIEAFSCDTAPFRSKLVSFAHQLVHNCISWHASLFDSCMHACIGCRILCRPGRCR
eukprot:TRINITY_DN9458_c0_g1_i2.p1 TRINITY_DN9458_c0_g1~~TRINITY_DN9458_c0_g1_i2.p1  ORF type:complete len:1116 (+),score=260.92 TRINITY_DN9458_c0_g1_i2:98-3349(+)